jgi:hypothetical protein
MNPKELDRITSKYNHYAFGLPDKFWDWYEKDFDIVRPVIYTRHAIERHTAKFCNPYRDLVTDMIPCLNVGRGEAFECWYLEDGTLRKFHLSLSCYYKQTKTWKWHDRFDYVASICFERGKYYVSTVYPRAVGNTKIYNKNQYSKP